MIMTMKIRSQKAPAAVLLSCLLAACAGVSGPQDDIQSAGPQAPSAFEKVEEAQVARDQGVYQETQARIATLNARQGIRLDNYALAKAQCWLDVSFHEYTRNDRGGFPRAALMQSQEIIARLEQGEMPNVAETPLVNGARRLRDDLWARHASLHQAEGLRCAASRLACAEVELVHAGNEIRQGGWRHASPYIQIAEDLTAEAEMAAQHCASDTPALHQDVAAPEVAVNDRPVSVTKLDVHFRFDQHGIADILPADLEQLRAFAEELKSRYVRIDSLNLIGYADHLGNSDYNTRLSLQRAVTVRAELQRLGLERAMGVIAMGAVREAPSHCAGLAAPDRVQKLQCLQPDRRVSIEVVGVRKS